MATLEREGIEPIDLVCVNLYPFEQTVAGHDVEHDVAIENIDIGGPTMIRAAAKNHEGVAVVVKPESYDAVLAELEESGRRDLRLDPPLARQRGLRPDRPLRGRDQPLVLRLLRGLPRAPRRSPTRRCSTSPTARTRTSAAALYAEAGIRSHVLSRVSKLHGRALSFNNVLDLDSARRLVEDFEQPACAIVKHNNPCGVAVADDAARGLSRRRWPATRCRPSAG